MYTIICRCIERIKKAFVFLKVTYNVEINKQNGKTYVVHIGGGTGGEGLAPPLF